MPGTQRIFLISTAASPAEVRALRDSPERDPLVLTAPTPDARRVVEALGDTGSRARSEDLLAPERFPAADRGHRLDGVVRGHALQDRFREVVVVADPVTVTLLLRVLAPDQLATGGAVTVVGLPRADRPVVVARAVAGGVVVGGVASLGEGVWSLLALPVATCLLGLALLLAPPWRHVARELLLASGIGVLVLTAVVAGSARFPGAW